MSTSHGLVDICKHIQLFHTLLIVCSDKLLGFLWRVPPLDEGIPNKYMCRKMVNLIFFVETMIMFTLDLAEYVLMEE